MRRLCRWTFTFAAAVSLLLMLGVLVLWPVSEWYHMRAVTVGPVGPKWTLIAGGWVGGGRAAVYFDATPYGFWGGPPQHWGWKTKVLSASHRWSALLTPTDHTSSWWSLPYAEFVHYGVEMESGDATLIVLFAILPALWLLMWRRRRRDAMRGRCPKCRYDLRGSAAAAIPGCDTPVITCPECGHVAGVRG